MSTATAEPTIQDQALVAQKSNTVLFLSRRAELRLIRVPRYPILAPGSGRQSGETQGEAIAFTNNQFVCPKEGTVTLEDGREVDAAEILEWMLSHKLLGDVNGGFWRVDPEAPAVTTEEIEALVTAASEGDEETLRRILAQEREGWQREQIIRVAEGSLERVVKLNQLLAAEAEREAAERGVPTPEQAAQAPADDTAAIQAAVDQAAGQTDAPLGDVAQQLEDDTSGTTKE